MLTITAPTDKFSAICKESICPPVMGSDFPLAVFVEKLCSPGSWHGEDINAFLFESDSSSLLPDYNDEDRLT